MATAAVTNYPVAPLYVSHQEINTVGLGYTTGSGGTATQATSKSTGVTLNTLTGQITMNAAALATVTTVSFVVTNSLVAATDVVHTTLVGASYATTATYSVKAEKMAAGSFAVTLKNESGGTLSEAVAFNFVVLKGAIS